MNRDLFWPTLVQNPKSIKRELLEKDLDIISGLSTVSSTNIILDESRRLYDQEQERRSTIDSKAGVYLAASTALIPILISLAPFVVKLEIPIRFTLSTTFSFLAITALVLALTILVRCVIWSHKALKVSPFHLLNWKELITHDDTQTLELQLIKKLLSTLRYNYDLTNDTATSVKMAHALLTSAMFWLIFGVAIQTVSFFLHGFDGALPSKDSLRPIVNIFTIQSELI
ncbi:hypothetical protein [Vibrio splendidus]|uniref:hypothetical protein n=1 Tax=Vibrio splendidus TaxID=29497 RepID=UPI000D356086|nr:hypothetical protein [Vibrio splendidus]PTP75244.1 hypothetical protein CWO00_13270 [Vibrio splendidus]